MNNDIKGEKIIKKRTLNINKLRRAEDRKLLNELAGKLEGVEKMSFNEEAGRLYFEYNLLKINLMTIEAMLAKLGFRVTGNFFSRLRRSWIHFTETNEYENYAYPTAHCCNVTGEGTVYNSLSSINIDEKKYTATD